MSNYLNPRGPSTGEFVQRPGSSLPVKNKRRGGPIPQVLLVGVFAGLFVGILQMKDPTKKAGDKKQSNSSNSVGLVAEGPVGEAPELPEVIKRAELPTEEIPVQMKE